MGNLGKASVSQQPSTATILILGTMKSPKAIQTSDKKRDAGSYLNGIAWDLSNMQEFVAENPDTFGTLFDSLQTIRYLSKETVLNRIGECAKIPTTFIRIYYSGKGQIHTGNWCFRNGVVTLDEVIDAVRSSQGGHLRISILADCCYSGNWARDLKKYKNEESHIYINAASRPGGVAWDTKEGGSHTLYWTDKRSKRYLPRSQWCIARLDEAGKYKMKCLRMARIKR